MTITLDGTNITYDDNSVQNTAAVINGQNLASGNGTLFADRNGNNLRFKRLAISGNFSVSSTGTTINLTYTGTTSSGGGGGAIK